MPKMPKRLNKQQRRDMLDLIAAVNSEEIKSRSELEDYLTDNELPEWFAKWTLWSAGENMPGYMPNVPYSLFLTERAAIGYCRDLESEEGGEDYVSDYMPVTLSSIFD